jgi:DNA-binding GntR family transcriptional regulator
MSISDTSTPGPARAQSLADEAYEAIRSLIVTLQLGPGQVVDERGLVEQLGIGRTPVREALRRLAQEQLIDVYPSRGMFVSNVNARDLARLTEVRIMLEPEAARLAATRATTRERESLNPLLAQLDRNPSSQQELMQLDERSHRAVYQLAHNPFLEATLEQYYTHALRIWHLCLEQTTRLEDAVHEHREILAAIRKQNPERAAETMQAHVLGFEQTLLHVLSTV